MLHHTIIVDYLITILFGTDIKIIIRTCVQCLNSKDAY